MLIEEIDIKEFLKGASPSPLINPNTVFTAVKNPCKKTQSEKKSNKELKDSIAEYYLHDQLVNAIITHGEIPEHPVETVIGIGMMDIADYSYLSSWLSPKENQILLNGLYSAFNMVLKKRSGFLNKIEGDSMMFHFGGIIDKHTKGLSKNQTLKYISNELFCTSLEIQRACRLFNHADKRFIDENKDPETADFIRDAFAIISNLRENLSMVSALDAMFQIRVRIGAAIGEVCIGNFGPKGVKQWDIIGFPVIEAKRMEATAPVGGLRITKLMYDILHKTGTIDKYYRKFINDAKKGNGYYRHLQKDELFKSRTVVIKEKKNVSFETYGIQGDPKQPEKVISLVESFLQKKDEGAKEVVDIIMYYRENRLILRAIEDVFKMNGIKLRKAELIKLIYYKKDLSKNKIFQKRLKDNSIEKLSLGSILKRLNKLQDSLHLYEENSPGDIEFSSYDKFLEQKSQILETKYFKLKRSILSRAHFYNYIYPMLFTNIKASILEWQFNKANEVLKN